MFVKSESACPQQRANDGCMLRELLHPDREELALPYSLAVAEVAVGACTYRHRLRHAEVYYILQGRGVMHIEDETRLLQVGDCVVIPAALTQWIENAGGEVLKFIAIVSPPWHIDGDERLD